MIREVVRDLKIADERIEFTPFPIDDPDNLRFILPVQIVCATTKLYDWNEEKIRRLTEVGYTAHVSEECVKLPYDESTIRSLILSDDDSWKTMVPPGVVKLVIAWGLKERLMRLRDQERVGT